MARIETGDLQAFLAVARERSFTRAAAQLGVSQSALSHTIRGMERRLGVRLLERTTRSVSPTEAGQRLLSRAGPRMDEIEAELEALTAFRETPAGTIRINASETALRSVLWPFIDRFAKAYPDIKIEVDVENGLIDIIEHGYDAGVRLGEQVARDMIATRIAPDWRMAVVATPSYCAGRDMPRTPDLGRRARSQAAWSERAARYRSGPPLRRTSRLIVDGDLPSALAIERKEHRMLSPRDISSRSPRLSALGARRRSAGRIPPVGEITENTEDDARSNNRPIDFIDSPACHRSQISDR